MGILGTRVSLTPLLLALLALAAAAQSPAPASPAPPPATQQQATPPAAEQTPKPTDPAAGADDALTRIKATTNEVNVVFTVTDKHGKRVTDLKKTDFMVSD